MRVEDPNPARLFTDGARDFGITEPADKGLILAAFEEQRERDEARRFRDAFFLFVGFLAGFATSCLTN